MKKTTFGLFVLLLCACDKPEPVNVATVKKPLEIRRTTTVGYMYPNAAAIKGNITARFKKDDISMGVLGYAKSTGSNDPGFGHVIGTFGLAEDNPGNQHYLIGVEGRVNGTSIDHQYVYQIGTLGLSTFVGSHFDKNLFNRYSFGVVGRSEIRHEDDKTPLNEGVAVNFYAPSPIGGAIKYGIIADEQGWFRDANSIQLGKDGVNTGSVTFASSASGNIKVKPQSGALGKTQITIPAISGAFVISGVVPANSKSAGKAGQIAVDANYFYWYAGSKWNRIAKDAGF